MDEEQRPLDRSPYYVKHSEHLDRVLSRPQLAGIGISGCIGGGILISSGTLIATTGSLGAAVSYVVAGGIVACVMYTITEMVACRPLTGALIDLPHTFLDPACGFAIAAMYGLGKICAMANLTSNAAELTTYLKKDQKPHSTGTEAAINIAFIALTTFSHCLGVKLYGRIERVVMWFKITLLLFVCIMMVILNFGGGGRKMQGTYSENYTKYAFTPGFKPNGYDSLGSVPLGLAGVSEDSFGISGPGGTVFAFITSITLAMFSCLGTDLVAMTAGEAKHPWKDIPITMSFVYLVPLTMYPFAMFAAGANVNYANPNLSKMWAKGNISTRSPFIVAAEESSLTALPKVLNAFFIVSAYTTANNDLYGASRSVFMLSQQYLPRRVANIFGRTNNGHTPLAAILLCSALGFLSLIGLADKSGSQPRITLSELYTGTATCINLFLCITFLRFKAGLDRLAKRRIFSRQHPLYRSRLFKSRWQPLPAYIGIVGSACVIAWSGIPPLVILVTKGSINSDSASRTQLKSTTSLLFDVVGAYIGPFVFASLYLSYKYIFPRTSHVDIRNLTVEDYVLEDLSSIELEGPASTPLAPRHGFGSHEMDAQTDTLVSPTHMFQDPFKEEHMHLSVSMDPDTQEEIETEAARNNERARIRQILERRPERMRRGVCREI
ncbi:hypothetical protein PTNB85_07725 [Pyrenophora teres f. teres]|nr:hypothetical protein PTNB85_07725 [Pyrenophora teres f. teres]